MKTLRPAMFDSSDDEEEEPTIPSESEEDYAPLAPLSVPEDCDPQILREQFLQLLRTEAPHGTAQESSAFPVSWVVGESGESEEVGSVGRQLERELRARDAATPEGRHRSGCSQLLLWR